MSLTKTSLDVLKLNLDEKEIIIDKLELRATCEVDQSLEESITESIHRLYGAIMPIPTQKIIWNLCTIVRS